MLKQFQNPKFTKLRDTLFLVFILALLLGLVEYGLKLNADNFGLAADSQTYTSVKELVLNNEPIEYVKADKNDLPDAIHPGQAGDVLEIGEVQFLFIMQPNNNFPLENVSEDQDINWAGVLVRKNEQSQWQRYFEIKRVKSGESKQGRYNAIGMFAWNDRLYLDIGNDMGGNGGEGDVIRFVSENGGQTWQKENCFYGPLAGYYLPSGHQREKINPDRVRENNNCMY